MKRYLMIISLAVLPIWMLPSSAFADEALLKKSGCLACHGIDKKVVGPAYTDVAAKYKGDAGARAALITVVKSGGKGNWTSVTGGVPMPPYSPRVSDANIETLVDYILSL